MAEIKRVVKADPVAAADGAVILMERILPALEHVDSSSGALGGSVGWALNELLPMVIDAPADRKTRDPWLDRLYQAILEDGVDYPLRNCEGRPMLDCPSKVLNVPRSSISMGFPRSILFGNNPSQEIMV